MLGGQRDQIGLHAARIADNFLGGIALQYYVAHLAAGPHGIRNPRTERRTRLLQWHFGSRDVDNVQLRLEPFGQVAGGKNTTLGEIAQIHRAQHGMQGMNLTRQRHALNDKNRTGGGA